MVRLLIFTLARFLPRLHVSLAAGVSEHVCVWVWESHIPPLLPPLYPSRGPGQGKGRWVRPPIDPCSSLRLHLPAPRQVRSRRIGARGAPPAASYLDPVLLYSVPVGLKSTEIGSSTHSTHLDSRRESLTTAVMSACSRLGASSLSGSLTTSTLSAAGSYAMTPHSAGTASWASPTRSAGTAMLM